MGLLKIISFALFFFQAIRAQDHCKPLLCGDNPFAVRFPFRLQDQQQPQHCGYPGFDLSCTSQKPEAVTLNLPYSGDFLVRDINYLVQEILLYDPNGCLPRKLLSLNLTSSPFMAGYTRNYTFLSCPPDLVKNRFTTIDCLSNSTSSVLATSSMNLARALDMCSTIVTLPVPVSWQQDDVGLASDLNQDLLLTWNVPNCEGCEARGGVCGFQNSTIDRIWCFSDQERGQTRGFQIFKIIALSIVVPAILFSMCISCFMCARERVPVQNSATAALAPPPSPPATAGLDESTIESYTKVVLGESRRLPGPNGATCPICLVEYHPKDALRCIPQCEHCFHSDCIDEWLRLNGTCPLCRNSPSPAQANT